MEIALNEDLTTSHAKPTISETTTARPSKPTRKSIDPEASDANKDPKHSFYYDSSPANPAAFTTPAAAKKKKEKKSKTKPS